jgi:predicted nucleotidyltransferase
MRSISRCCCGSTARPGTGAESAVLEASGYDVDVAGARLLGRDAARISRAETRRILWALLDDGPTLERLARVMVREMGAAPDPVALARDLIGRFRTGLHEG